MWKNFHFDGNLINDIITCKEHFMLLCATYNLKPEKILQARQKPGFPDSFGFRLEHDSERTLKDFFEENNMELN